MLFLQVNILKELNQNVFWTSVQEADFHSYHLPFVFHNRNFWHGFSTEKMDAISRMTSALHIHNVDILVGRMEEFGRNPKHREQYDVVTARAVAPFAVTAELASPFLKTGGLFLAYRGPEWSTADEQIASLLNIKCIQKKYSLPEGEKRILWIFEKRGKHQIVSPRSGNSEKETTFYERIIHIAKGKTTCTVNTCQNDLPLKTAFFRKAKQDGFRARSAYKLEAILKKFPEFLPKMRQYLILAVHQEVFTSIIPCSSEKLIGVDLQKTDPIENVTLFQGDIFPKRWKRCSSTKDHFR